MENKQNREWQTAGKEMDLTKWADHFNWVEEYQVSCDGEHVAAIVNVDEAQFTVCVDGQPWDLALEKAWSLRFLPDNRLAVLGCEDEEWTVYIDGVPWENRFDYIWNLMCSADGTHVAAAIQQGMEYGMAVDDTVWETLYENMTCPVLSDHGTTAAVVQTAPLGQGDIQGFKKGIFSAALNGNVMESSFMNVWDLAFDPSGEKLAYVIRKNRMDYSIAQNETPWETNFQSAWRPVFANQGKSLLAPVRIGGKWYLYKDDARFWDLPFEQLWNVTLSPDEERIAAIVSKNYGRWTVCEDLKIWDIHVDGMIRDLDYFADGKKLWAVCRHKDSWDLAINGRLQGLSAEKLWSPVTAKGSGIVAARMVKNNNYHYAVNGKIYPEAFDFAFDPVIHPDGRTVMFCTITNGIYTKQTFNLDAL